MLVTWCKLVLSTSPVAFKSAGLTVADEPTFKAIMARGLLAGDETVCDFPGVMLWVAAQVHEKDPAGWCRASFSMLRAQGSFTVTDHEDNAWVTVTVAKP